MLKTVYLAHFRYNIITGERVIMGMIYRHVSPSGKSYVGKTKYSWQERAGKYPLYAYAGSTKFYHAIKKYGWDNFEHLIVEDNIEDPDLLSAREKYWISFYDSQANGYNMRSYEGVQELSDRGEVDIRELSRLYQEEGHSLREISDLVGIDFQSVRFLLKSNGVEMKHFGYVSKKQKSYNERKKATLSSRKCLTCEKEFLPKRKTNVCCSKECNGFQGALASHMGKSIRKRDDEQKLLQLPPDLRNEWIEKFDGNVVKAVRTLGGIKSGHVRWHENNYSDKCIFCQREANSSS